MTDTPKEINVHLKVFPNNQFTMDVTSPDYGKDDERFVLQTIINCVGTYQHNLWCEDHDKELEAEIARRKALGWFHRKWLQFKDPLYDSSYKKIYI